MPGVARLAELLGLAAPQGAESCQGIRYAGAAHVLWQAPQDLLQLRTGKSSGCTRDGEQNTEVSRRDAWKHLSWVQVSTRKA